ncbi:hypothetical protein F5Y16DRAFT_375561 [Xylariaceae sp. FL0255]|nr:hypothetical protein F5Y16DRAFT_375561 [Xylariaceae sp. FL0255]
MRGFRAFVESLSLFFYGLCNCNSWILKRANQGRYWRYRRARRIWLNGQKERCSTFTQTCTECEDREVGTYLTRSLYRPTAARMVFFF